MATTTKPRAKKATGAAGAGKTSQKERAKAAADPNVAQDATWRAKRINLQKIKTSYNHRNPLSTPFQQEGYGVFEQDVPPGSDKEPLWLLGTSDDPAKRLKFTELMDQYDGDESQGGGIVALAWNILNVGLINPINVRDNGDGEYQLVAGHRRSLAALYLWCKGLIKNPFPVMDARLETGNSNHLQARAVSENLHRKRMSLIEQARAYRMAINGGETADQIAEREHCSVQTVQQRISLLELPPEDQKKVEDGRLKYTDAIEIVRDKRAGGTGKTRSGKSAGEAADAHAAKGGSRNRQRTRKEVEERWAKETNAEWRAALAWVLKMDGSGDDSSSNGATGRGRGTVTIPEKIVPGDVGAALEEEAEEIELDGKGRPVKKK